MGATRRRGSRRGRPGAGLPRGQDPVSEMIRLHRAERVIENLHNIPDRGSLDDYDRPSEGLGRKKLAFRGLTEEELATNAVNSRTLAPDSVLNTNIGEQIQASKLPNIGGLSGSLPQDKLPPGVITGNVQRGNIANKAVHPSDHVDWTVPKDDFIPIRMLESRPWPSQDSVNAKTSKAEADEIARAAVRRMVPKKYRN